MLIQILNSVYSRYSFPDFQGGIDAKIPQIEEEKINKIIIYFYKSSYYSENKTMVRT